MVNANIKNITLDLSNNNVDSSNNIVDSFNNTVDLSNNQVNLSNNQVDLSNNIVDLSNNQVDLSNNEIDSFNDITLDLSNNEIDSFNNITCICLSGGGMKGFAYIGAFEKLIAENIINMANINKFVGTSIGAIICFFLNLGMSIEELKAFLFTFNFSKLTGDVDCCNLFELYGIDNGARVELLFVKFLEMKFNVKDITFAELYKLTNKTLIIIGTNLSRPSCAETVFSYDTTPLVSVLKALRISMAVPIIFTPVIFENEMYVDCGIINNFPIDHCPENNTLGIYIKQSRQQKIDSIQSVISTCLGIVTDRINEQNIEKYKKNIITILNPNYEVIRFDLSLEYIKSIFDLGTDAATLFCSTRK